MRNFLMPAHTKPFSEKGFVGYEFSNEKMNDERGRSEVAMQA
jgi:hypothetical protein